MLLAGLRDAGAQVVRGGGLAGARDIVELAFDRQQGSALDVLRTHRLAVDDPRAIGQAEFLEHRANRLEVVLGRHIEHGVVLVIELDVRLGVVRPALDQAQVVVIVRRHMAVRVHRHEAGVLQEARIDAAAVARVVGRHRVDDVVLEPLVRLVGGKRVDRRCALSRVDRATHHRHGARGLLTCRRHQRDRGKHRHGRLAHRDHIQVLRANVADELLDVTDVVGQMELAMLHRHHAGVHPVGHIDFVVLQQSAHGIAQQRRVVAGQRRADQHDRLVLEQLDGVRIVRIALEAHQLAERLVQDGLFDDRNVAAIRTDGFDVEFRLFVGFSQSVQQFVACCQPRGAGDQ